MAEISTHRFVTDHLTIIMPGVGDNMDSEGIEMSDYSRNNEGLHNDASWLVTDIWGEGRENIAGPSGIPVFMREERKGLFSNGTSFVDSFA